MRPHPGVALPWASALHRAGPVLRTAAVSLAAAQVAPALTALPGLRSWCLPGLNGGVGSGRVALTFDDGPDPESTPWFLAVLAEHSVRATFFVLGSMLERSPDLGRRIVAAGHEVGVHGWEHRNLLLRGPVATWRELSRTRDLVTAVTGRRPLFFRPPYGVLTGAALLAARRLDLRPVLWTCWGRDWTRTATGDSVHDTVRAGLGSGGTILLHDSDCTAAPGAWRSSLAALPRLLAHCRRQGWAVGPLGEQRALDR
ncbi:polysaccharide deacetylase family protein [Micromonospora siamensis]|uniref:Peptidoglycan/xylan/chitin deacetylase, PgdA/CDA1 family n=1 Tax=Micromonospora siamensis TaxID=299152 RepID=A0A1C5ITA1_9ACTN|nr:polysaccharide deacetylase family protein [Micromonospora siamensis]SCG61383.1 Peptidoglycan/xylan/chitin deacetylase, PgdA/CDA1 family [Micromonospora siamensis]